MRSLLIETHLPIASKKSGQVIRKTRGGRRFIAQNSKVEDCQKELARLFYVAAKGKPIFGTDSVRVDMQLDKTTGETIICVESICPKPKRNNGRKQDPINQLQLVLDAMEKSGIIVNDNQVADARVRRMVNGELC